MSRALPLCTLGLAALVASPALAFAPHDSPAWGIDGERVLTYAPHTQAHLAHQPAWQRFVQGEGNGWQARFDEQTGTPHRMWGAPIDIGPTATADDVVDGLLAFADRHADLLGADASRLVPRSVRYNDTMDTWYAEFDVLVAGIPVEGGGITARVRGGRLVMLGADTFPDATLQGTRRMSRDLAVTRALENGPAPLAHHEDVASRLVAVPVLDDEGRVVLRTAWRTSSRTRTPVGVWDTFVDAETGEVFGARNNVRYITGTVYAEHDLRTVNGDTVISPLPFARIADGNGTRSADAFGSFDLVDGPVSVTLRSPYFRVLNSGGPEGVLDFEGPEGIFGDEDATPAERSTYVFLHEVREWGERVAPGLIPGVMDANVNLNETCNAYFDGDVNFFKAGSGCNNTGRIADVVFHEWGHGFHYYSLEAGTFDGSLSEGAADVVAFLQTGDPVIAPYFMTNGSGIRNVEPDRVYPDDYTANDQYVHSNGLIFGGAMWDLWKALKDEHGNEEGTRLTEEIFAGLLKGGPTVETSYDEAIFADDDDDDLSNGTPNQCEIAEAFGKHGLGPLGSGTTFLAYHEPITEAPVNSLVDLDIDLRPAAPQCFDFDPAGAMLHFRVNGGPWQDWDLDIEAEAARGALPPLPLGAVVEYWVEVLDADGNAVTAPDGGIIHPFTYYVGDVIPVHCDDFEQSDGGYTHELLEGTQTEGADDWQWGRPQGTGGDPGQAASGDKVWGNDLGGGRFNGQYQDGKHNRLSSPAIDTKHYTGVFLRYQRWLGVEDGTYDTARILANDESVWTNWANPDTGTDHHQDRQWVPHVVDLHGIADQGEVTLSWEIESDRGLSFSGWTLDDVCLMAPATPDNRLGITDFTAEGGGSAGVTLSWTNPPHRPLREIVVVRKRGSFPRNPRQGQVVFQDESPERGAEMSVPDPEVGDSPGYYAVFASDGTHWLSWSVEGWNAAAASADGGEVTTGRGCTTAPASGGLAPAWLLLGLLALRRRRD